MRDLTRAVRIRSLSRCVAGGCLLYCTRLFRSDALRKGPQARPLGTRLKLTPPYHPSNPTPQRHSPTHPTPLPAAAPRRCGLLGVQEDVRRILIEFPDVVSQVPP